MDKTRTTLHGGDLQSAANVLLMFHCIFKTTFDKFVENQHFKVNLSDITTQSYYMVVFPHKIIYSMKVEP